MTNKEKRKDKKKKKISYDTFSIQPYLTIDYFRTEHKNLLFSLRSKRYNAKIYLKKLNRGNMKCRFNCES